MPNINEVMSPRRLDWNGENEGLAVAGTEGDLIGVGDDVMEMVLVCVGRGVLTLVVGDDEIAAIVGT